MLLSFVWVQNDFCKETCDTDEKNGAKICLQLATTFHSLFSTSSHIYLHNGLATVEPPNKGHFGNGANVLSSEVVRSFEVHHC